MCRLTMMAGALCIALLTGTGAFAQVAPNPNNLNASCRRRRTAALWRSDQH